jgi:Na+-driven multidrug efflux pump
MGWPLALKAFMLHGIIVVDAYLVSPLGEEALAAMGLAGAISGLLLGVLFAFSNATQIRIAQAQTLIHISEPTRRSGLGVGGVRV